MTQEEIKTLLPHREPMLLLDSTSLDPDGTAHGFFRIPEHPFYCEGHFPGKPIVPGVILCEIMAQSTCQLYPDVLKDHLLVYRGLDKVKFRGNVRPGDLCEVSCHLLEQKGNLFVSDATLSVDGKICARATIELAALPK